jgi:flagellar protein FliO/FliZ
MMRPRLFEKAPATAAGVLVCCLLLGSVQAQTPPAQPGKYPATNSGLATAAIPNEMWNSNGQNQPQQGQPQQSQPQSDQTSTFRSQPGSPLPELRSSTPSRISTGSSVAPALATQSHFSQQAGVVQASHESQRATSLTPLPPKSKADETAKPKAGGSTLQMFISLGSSLAIVIGLFLGVAVLYRKSVSTTLGRGLPKNVVQVLGRTSIAPRQQMLLVRFGSKLVLVSMIQGEARTISEITDPLEVDQLAGYCEGHSSGSATSSFREILTQGAKV